MPLAALALKENLAGAVGLKTCDKEHSSASLGDSEIASIESSPPNRVPEVVNLTEQSDEITALIGTEETWHIFKEQPARSALLHKVKEGEGEAGSLACKSCALACDAEVLAGKPA
jgi:hypothetical protein